MERRIDRKWIGHTFAPYTRKIDASQLSFFAKTIGETNPIYLDKFVELEASKLYDFAVQSPKGGAGNGGGPGGDGGSKLVVPTSEEAYSMAIIEAGTQEERDEITAAYEASK